MFRYKLFQIDGLYFELVDTPEDVEYLVKMLDENKQVIYETSLRKNMWAKCNRKYLADYTIEMWNHGTLEKSISFLENLKGEKVFISFESSSLGDTIAWMPYALEFKNKYGCDVVVSTFKNFMFKDSYPEITFAKRGEVVNNIVAMYKIGWFYNKDMEPVLPSTIPLQKTATNILNLDYQEVRPRLAYAPGDNIYGKYITISTKSTSQCKHWYYWQELVNALIEKGYKVVELSMESDKLDGVIYPEDTSIENTMKLLHHCHIYIGLSSGISWLAWAINKKVVMISNFTRSDHEFSCIRITNKDVCHGCWNNPLFKFNKGDWNWCPEHEHTDRQFECHKQITVDQVMGVLSDHI